MNHIPSESEINLTSNQVRLASEVIGVLHRNPNITPEHAFRAFITDTETLGLPVPEDKTGRGIFSLCIRGWATETAEATLRKYLRILFETNGTVTHEGAVANWTPDEPDAEQAA